MPPIIPVWARLSGYGSWQVAAAGRGLDQGGQDDPDFHLVGLGQDPRAGDHGTVEKGAGCVDLNQQVKDAGVGEWNLQGSQVERAGATAAGGS